MIITAGRPYTDRAPGRRVPEDRRELPRVRRWREGLRVGWLVLVYNSLSGSSACSWEFKSWLGSRELGGVGGRGLARGGGRELRGVGGRVGGHRREELQYV